MKKIKKPNLFHAYQFEIFEISVKRNLIIFFFKQSLNGRTLSKIFVYNNENGGN